ncbi:dipeptidase PepE [uncultured Rikenella sp.]|uniref:dipeptidase PepE n=1 Tax=uncultured Rikenella sp. TaxID=368003 RepID=UPI00262CEF7B|nr:dipeptidase PepE [uncultured Rikenella sp.]
MRLLLISNSTNAGEAYLEYPKPQIADFLAVSATPVKRVLFVPYAAVTFSYDDYQAKVANRFAEFGVEVDSVHTYADPVQAVRNAQAIVVGGGNTFHLAKTMQDQGLYEPIREAVLERGVPYIGWSAGSNMSCPTICTTNDMPIVEPLSFKALGLIPFQINPHYLDAHPEGHAGETREMRIEEYIAANKGMRVAGLREGCMLRVEGRTLSLIGPRTMRLFRYGTPPRELAAGEELSFLLND